MFRKFSLFDSSPPPAKISVNPPRPPSIKAQRKSPIKCAIINTLQFPNAPELTTSFFKPTAKRSKSLDHSNNRDGVKQAFHRSYPTKNALKAATLPPLIINRELPQAPATSHRWYTRFGNSLRRGAWARRHSIAEYQVKYPLASGKSEQREIHSL
jgi:hypothetical protein